MKTNPNRVGRVLKTTDAPGESRWTTTKAPYTSPLSQRKEAPVIPMSTLPSIAGIASAVVLERGKAKLFQEGNPLIYGGACRDVIGEELSAGDEVLVVESGGACLGRGIYNPHSQYRVRVLSRVDEATFSLSFEDLIKYRFRQAASIRTALGLGESTSVYRLVNGEGDRLSGLIIDVMGDVVVIQSSAIWCEINKSVIERSLREVLNEHTLFQSETQFLWRRATSRLKQDGADDIGLDIEGPEEETSEDCYSRVVLENGVKYSINPWEGQKTGFYSDQRANRDMIRQLARDKKVLDTFCYTGGFSVNAMLGGAKDVTCVDSSQRALDEMARNVEMNDIDAAKVTVRKDDCIAFMREQLDSHGEGQYDIVICDPPKLAPKRTAVPKAVGKYTKINRLGMQLTRSGGLLLTCTCSAAMTQQPEIFRRMLQDAARQAGVEISILSTTGAASCHVMNPSYPEGSYLTAVLCSVTRPGEGQGQTQAQ